MKKKAYITPETVVVDVELQLLQTFSGGNGEEVQVDPGEDDSDNDGRSRRSYWDFDDEDF